MHYLGILLVGFVVFAAVAYFMTDATFKKLATFGAAICMLVFVVVLLLHVAGVATPGVGWQ